MRRFKRNVLAAALATSSLALAGPATISTAFAADAAKKSDASPQASSDAKKSPATQPATFMLVVPVPLTPVVVLPPVPITAARLAPDAEPIRDTLAQATEAAITEDGLDDMVERFVDADRNRLGTGDLDEDKQVNAAAERLRQAWKTKFGSDIDIHREGYVYGAFPIIQGIIADGEAQPAGATFAPNAPEDYNLEVGREVAVVTVPAAAGLPEAIVPMLEEAAGWKIDVPNTLTPGQFKAKLVEHLNVAADQLPKLEGDADSCKRWLTHHVLATMGHGIEPPSATPQQQQEQPQQQKQDGSNTG